ncbi:MAG TPA: FtsX-like permease family protein [Acidimicrobiales bacterium]|nr:FtsX-like permease family protein [Acidimicrobiales bacterium]
MSVAWYLFRATLRRRWPGLLAIVLLLGLVGGLAMGSIAGARRTESSYPTFLAGTDPSDLLVQPTQAVACSSDLIGQIARLPHVRGVTCAGSFNAGTLTPTGGLSKVLLAQVELIASADGEYSSQDRVTITSGRRADPSRPDELVATPSAAAFLGLHVGSHVSMGIWANNQNTLTPHRVIRMTVVGIGVFNTQVVQDDIDRGNTGFLLGTPALLHEFESCCQAGTYDGIQLRGGSRSDTTVEHEYAHLLDTSPDGSSLQVYVTSVIEAEAQTAIHPEAIALGVFGVIAALAALLIGIQAVSRQLRAGAEDTSVLRAVGAGPPVTSTDGLLGIVGAVMLGSLLAGAVAVGLSPLAPFGPVRAVDPSPGVAFDWTVLGLGMLALFVVVAGVALALAYRQAPHRATSLGPVREHGSNIVQLGLAAGIPVSGVAGLRFALESGRGRSAVPVRSIMLGAVLAIMVVTATLTFGASLNTLVSRPQLYGWNFDYALYSTDGYGPVPSRVVQPLLAHDPSVASTTGVYFGTAELDSQVVPLLIESAHAAIAPPVLSGHRLNGPGQVVLGAATLAQLHKRVGDTVVVRAYGVAVRLRVVGTATLPTIGEVISVHPTMSTGALLPTSAVPTALLDQFGPASGPNALFIRLHPGSNPAVAQQSLEKIAHTALQLFRSPQAVAQNGPGAYGVTIQLLGPQRPAEIVNYRTMGTTPVYLAAGLAVGTVAALALTLMASVRRRRREMALLKTFGFTQRQLAAAVAWQATIVAVVGLVVGIPLGIALGRFLWDAFAHQLSVVVDPTVAIVQLALVGLGAIVVANLVAALPGRIAARTPTALVLRAE